jgi:uncharacterized protein YbjT (DUF2867 family)
MAKEHAAIIGGTGLIGSQLLSLILKEPQFADIYVITRRNLEIPDKRVIQKVIDFNDDESFKKALSLCPIVFCCVGTTQNKVKGDLLAYRKVDFDIPVKAARFCEENGGKSFLLVSSVGAAGDSKNFYLALKGAVEDAVVKREIPSISIFRPSLLLGKRNEFRLAEKISALLMKSLSFLIPSKYRPIEAAQVAKSMYRAAVLNKPGIHIYHFAEMIAS